MEDEIIKKLDEILAILGHGRQRSAADIKRQAEADVIRLTEAKRKRMKGHVRANEKPE